MGDAKMLGKNLGGKKKRMKMLLPKMGIGEEGISIAEQERARGSRARWSSIFSHPLIY